MICKNCGTEIGAGERFCMRCGQPVQIRSAKRHCGYCGTELETDASFCWKCGQTVLRRSSEAAQSTEHPETSQPERHEADTNSAAEEKARLKARTETLVMAAQAGNVDCFTELYQLYYGKVYALARTTVKSDADAEDVLQTTFLKAWNNLSKLKNAGAFSTWIQRITLNQCYSLLRSRHVDVSIDEEDEGAEPIQLESDLMLPEVYAERSDLKARLGRIIRELSAVQQQTVTLYYYDGLPVENIAWIMDCGVNTVKSRLFLARKSIKTEIEEQERKTGEKFYGVTGLGVVSFGKLFLQEVEASALSKTTAAAVLQNVAARISTAARSAAVGQGTVGAGKGAARSAANAGVKAGAKAAAKAGTRTAASTVVRAGAKAAAGAVTKKIVAIALTAVLVTGFAAGGTVAAVRAISDRQQAEIRITENDPTDDTNGARSTPAPTEKPIVYTRLSERERAAYEAYLSLLKQEKRGIDNYIWQKGYTLLFDDNDFEMLPLTDDILARPVAICDVYGDDLPELIYIGGVEEGRFYNGYYDNDSYPILNVVTYRDGRLVTLYTSDRSGEEPNWCDGYGDSWYEYHLFQIDGSKDLYFQCANGDLSWWDYVSRLKEGTDGKLHAVQVCMDFFEEGEPDGHEYWYAQSEERITKDAYDAIVNTLNDETRTILMYSTIGTDYRSSFERAGSINMTADEAIAYLMDLLGQDGQPEGQAAESRLLRAYAAYREYLIPRMDGIDNYVWQIADWEQFYTTSDAGYFSLIQEPLTNKERTVPRSVVLCDIYGDSVPELIYVGDVAFRKLGSVSTLNVLTYERGRVKTLYVGTWDEPEWGDLVGRHALLLTPDKRLVFCRAEGDTFDFSERYEAFTLGEDGKLHREPVLEHLCHGEDGSAAVTDIYRGRNGSILAPEDYATELSALVPQGTVTIFDRHGYADYAMTAWEALDKLTTKLNDALPVVDAPAGLPTKFFLGSGAGASGDWMTIDWSGSLRSLSYDWDGGEDGPGYSGTYWNYGSYSCRFRDLKQINDYTYIFTVYDIVIEDHGVKEEIRNGIRYVYADGCPFTEGSIVTVYTKNTPASAIPEEILEMYWMATVEHVLSYTPCCMVIYGDGYRGWFAE